MRMHLTYANVMATIAVFIALGGSSYAAVTLSQNSVRSKHIKNGQVKRGDLGRSAVDSTKVKDGALLRRDFRAGQIPAGPQGPQGPQGDTGRQGEAGLQGPPGPTAADGSFVSPFRTLPAWSTYDDVASLTLTMTAESRIVVSGTVVLRGNGANDDAAECRIAVARGGGTLFSGYGYTGIADTATDHVTLPVTATFVDRPAGDDSIRLQCARTAGTVVAERASLTAIAAAAAG